VLGVAPAVHVLALRLALRLHLLDDGLHHVGLLLCLDLLQVLVQSVDFLLGFEAAVQPKDPGRVAVCHVALVTFLALEEDLTLVATEQTDVMHLVLVPVPVGPGLGDLAAQLAGAAAVVVDHVVEGDVAPGQLLLLRDDQGAVDI